MNSEPLSTDRLAKLVCQKRQVLQQLRQVAVRQGELIGQEDVSTLLKLLATKQALLSGLQKLERALEPFRGQDPEDRPWPTPADRAACAADAADCARLLEEVIQLEREHERQMVAQRDRVAGQLRIAHSAHQAAGAYSQ
ncbi:MAG: hypothetical protein KDA37_03755 [Planctomycetales bacterium]|nr:hypothetical protein [Planctomycetales bacterium]